MNLLQNTISKELRDEFSLYLENLTMGSLFRFFSRYFSATTRPTQFLLTWLVIAQLALQSFPSLRFLHRNFLSSVTHRCLNSYYRAFRNETVTNRSLRLQTAALACSLIPAALQNEPVFFSVDDTTVPKFGRKFDAVFLLYDHACHTGKTYVNGHCFVSLTLSVPIKRIHLDDFTLSWEMDGMRVDHRLVLTNINGNRRIHAYVSCTASGSRRLFFSTLDPSDLHMSYAWQERKILQDAPADGIEHMVNWVNLVHSSLKMLPYLDEHFAKYKNANPQELRSHLSWQIQREIFFDTLVSKAQTAKNSTDFVQALCKLVSVTTEAA